ncbi:heme peroxidase [Aspergillus vadensis CBS 113365]|uniref:Peroxidase n=1 Tax=Aspergillus vadensis (strain CBS 113365 / IMI 142717 / IBT 24658) TaxID=1448311 RepID=A0A319BMT3_ASPVC|nr:heme peroxidase [Aspergillus vadensis CBS 113365]PYH73654.1 heme peroxidase [Aspergillus vadensis CBS 113365]
MASAARTASRAFLRSTPATSSFRPAARSARFALPSQGFRAASRRGYASEAGEAKSSNSLLWAGIAAAGGVGAYFYLKGGDASVSSKEFVPTKEDYQKVYDAVAQRLANETDYDDGSYGPVLVRLAWHASGTYDKETGTGGSNGATMRFAPESDHGANAGLKHARDFLEPIKAQFPWITYSDLWTLAGACAIQELGGPAIPWRPGRQDKDVAACTPDGRLPDATKEQSHIRDIFYRMGFNDQEIVALVGAHSLGRAHTDRSGFDGPWDFSPTVFTNEFFRLLVEEKWQQRKWNGPKQFTDKTTGTLMMMPADLALTKDKAFRKYVELYAKDSDLFFKDFSNVFVKLLELGVPFKTEDRYVFKTSESNHPLTQDHYEVLNLPFTETPTALSKQQLKAAYHKALLKHHPDKAPGAIAKDVQTSSSSSLPTSDTNSSSHTTYRYTIDEITTAYKTLSDPYLRAEYDRSLRLDRARVAEREKTGTVFHTGLEVVDLEDLACDESDADAALWYRGCRCGDERGFLVTEQDLEREAEHGEIVVGCRGCSLWMKVLFAVEDGDEEDT